MIISLKDESAFQRWRRLVIVQDDSQLREPSAALDKAKIPHVVGLHYRYKTPTGKPREAEQWIMVPFHYYSAACSLLFSLPKCHEHTSCSTCSEVQVPASSD
jgi:hypothetical protein